ncbi:hypothetical protein EYC84_003455 [Monilinia fructicola]|uniref:Uncharacterized protein n=1 Tax=Monilinia fructicola TaxID=38448 RepID=A0A5M9K1W1_MONFR|nr:hypothetical protein EYC84_003455 [Monilinia fructicola]
MICSQVWALGNIRRDFASHIAKGYHSIPKMSKKCKKPGAYEDEPLLFNIFMMASDESIPTLKILLIGPSGAGKSALLIRYCDDQFDSESSTATIGVDFKLKTLSIHGKPYRLNLLDTAGQERFRTLSNSYYRGAHAVILVYDVTNRESFNSMGRWVEEAEGNAVDGGSRGALRLAVETIAILRAALARIYGLTASRIMGFSRVL